MMKLILLLSLIALPIVGNAESDCLTARNGAYALLSANGISNATINAVANDVLVLRLNALSEAQSNLAALGPEPQNGFFTTWSMKSFSQIHQRWLDSRQSLEANVTYACELLTERVKDVTALSNP